jgi:hypothetical protein
MFQRNTLPPSSMASTLKMEAAGSSKTLVTTYQTTQFHNFDCNILIFFIAKASHYHFGLLSFQWGNRDINEKQMILSKIFSSDITQNYS